MNGKTKDKVLRELVHGFVGNMDEATIDTFCERSHFELPLTPRLKKSFDRWFDKTIKKEKIKKAK